MAALVGILSCRPEAATTTANAGDGLTPEEVASTLVAALESGDFGGAARLTITDQLPWVVMAEGASLAQAAGLQPADLVTVAENYWEGFSGSAPQLPAIEAGAVEEAEVGGLGFATVPLEGRLRLVLRREESWRLDIIASFAPTLVNRLIESAELVEANRGEDADLLRQVLSQQWPSVEMASRQPGLPSTTRDDLARLLEILADLTG
jgi:hypothetical protein